MHIHIFAIFPSWMFHIANRVIFGFILLFFFPLVSTSSLSIWYHSYCLPFFALLSFYLSSVSVLFYLSVSLSLSLRKMHDFFPWRISSPCLCCFCRLLFRMCFFAPFISSFLWLLLLFNFQLFVGVLRFHLFAIEIFMRSAFCVYIYEPRARIPYAFSFGIAIDLLLSPFISLCVHKNRLFIFSEVIQYTFLLDISQEIHRFTERQFHVRQFTTESWFIVKISKEKKYSWKYLLQNNFFILWREITTDRYRKRRKKILDSMTEIILIWLFITDS